MKTSHKSAFKNAFQHVPEYNITFSQKVKIKITQIKFILPPEINDQLRMPL